MMFFEELLHAYDMFEKNGEVSVVWDFSGKVHFGLDIDDDGKLNQIITYMQDKKPQLMRVPATVKKETSGVCYKYIYGNTKYMLGYEAKKQKGKTKREFRELVDSFEITKTFHEKLLEGINTPVADAIRLYFSYYSTHHDELLGLVDWENHKEYDASYFIICYNGVPVTKYPEIIQAWERYFPTLLSAESEVIRTSLVSGEKGPIQRTHNAIRGAGGTNPSIISFNADSFESYNLKQSYNAAFTVEESLRYVSALNYMLNNDDYHYFLNGMQIVLWSANTKPIYSRLGKAMFSNDKACELTQEELLDCVEKIVHGKRVDINGTDIDPEEKFFIAGIQPNGGRLQLTIWLESSFGRFVKNIDEHYDRMRIVNDEDKVLSPYQIVCESVRSIEHCDKKIKTILLKSILTNSNYPSQIYNGLLERVRKGPKEPVKTKVTTGKAQVLKMFLNKNRKPTEEEITMGLNKESTSVGYQCGRMFAVAEKVQKDATKSKVKNLAVRYFNSAMATPANAFSIIMRLNQCYMKKFNDEGVKVYYDKLFSEINGKIDDFPKHLSQTEQGRFCLGYYHQKEDLYKAKGQLPDD